MPDVTLKKVTYTTLEEIFHISPTQVNVHEQELAPGPESLGFQPTWDNQAQPFGIYIDDELVGIYCMTCFSEKDTLWLGGYLIEDRYHAHGYGQTSLVEILKKICQNHPYCNTINLAVEPETVVMHRICQNKH